MEYFVIGFLLSACLSLFLFSIHIYRIAMEYKEKILEIKDDFAQCEGFISDRLKYMEEKILNFNKY